LADLESEAAAVREVLEHHYSDQRIEMEIAATVKNLQVDYPECADYSHVEEGDIWEVLDEDGQVIDTVEDMYMMYDYLVSLDTSEVYDAKD
jgi:hypothetical protein